LPQLGSLPAPVLHFALVEAHGRIVRGNVVSGQCTLLRRNIGRKPMDDPVEAFLQEVLALEG